ncbi:SusC/RagA family TonB-linked outer membrane protein [Niabella aurantiaca]|uniref:SusC/RagA family TonB-linked outer membrane protein n=1 Tax=Niabella aurantiaca TaxID=379900 RepID=UPI00037C4AF0|nr:TonB-dependent receptor [Niabella aurantiaca]
MSIAFSGILNAQTTITGTITNQDGAVVPDATVSVKDLSVTTSATSAGKYFIVVRPQHKILVFSSVGYITKEVNLSGKTVVNVILEKDISNMNEVIVTGYTATAKKDLTGAVGTVNVEDMQKAPVRSFEEALAGRVAGVQVTSQSGRPGSAIDIVIRGVGSISQSNQPLFVIDGFPLEDPDNNMIDPNDIETMSVLKDASATALYGARGSNGVIVITTKRGVRGQPRVNYLGSYGINETTRYMDLLSPYEFVKIQSDLPGTNPYLTDGRILEDYRNEKGIDWQAMLFQTGSQQNHSVSLTGGTDGTRYSLSGNYFAQDGIIINSSFRRYQGKMTLDQTIGKRFKVGGAVRYTNNLTKGDNSQGNGGQSALFYQAFSYRPIAISGNNVQLSEDLYDPEGNGAGDYRVNPVLSEQNAIRNSTSNNVVANLYIDYKIAKYLKLELRGSSNNNFVRVERFNNSKTRTGGKYSPQGVNGSIYNYRYDYYDNTNLLDYTRNFKGKHSLNVVAGMEMQMRYSRALGYSATLIPEESLGLSGIDAGTITTPPVNSVSKSTMASWLGSVAYNYKSKYYLTGNFRADGSSKFMNENQWGYFPSGAVKWKFSEEAFLKKSKWLSDGNIRFSYGTTGNNRVGDFDTYSRIIFSNAVTFSGVLQPNSAVISSLQNPALRWESTTSTDLGVDLGFWKNRITLTVDLYKRATENLLFKTNLPPSSGYGSVMKNIAKISNKGLEFTLKAHIIQQKQFTYTSDFNISFNRNRLEGLSDPDETAILTNIGWDPYYNSVPAYIAKIGSPLGQMYGLVADGLYQYSDFDKMPNGSYVLKPNGVVNTFLPTAYPRPGDSKYKDINGDGVVDADDRVVIGNGYPLHTGGWSNNFRYKNFDLNIFFQWSYGNSVINANRQFFATGLNIYLRNTIMPGQNALAEFANRWTPQNQDTDIPQLNRAYFVYSSQFVEDGSFLRLKTINLGYTLPQPLLKRIHAKSMRVYVATSNIYTWTKYKGFDPELSAFQSALSPGLDFSTYPRPFTIVAGLNLSL